MRPFSLEPRPRRHHPRAGARRNLRTAALLHRAPRLLPPFTSLGHHEHVLVSKRDRRTGGLVAGHSMRVVTIEDELPILVLRKIGLLHVLERDPPGGRDVGLHPLVLPVV